jgi:hypothetical protein
MKKSYSLFLLFTLTMFQAFAQPTTAPATPPARSAANVLSIYSTAYTNHVGTDFKPYWGQAQPYTTPTNIAAGSDNVWYYPNMTYQGIDFGGGINIASLDTLHLDIWTPNCTKLNVYLIDAPADHENFVTVNLTLSGWNSIAIPLSQYSSQGCTLNNIIQFKFVSNTPASSSIYLDNIYFYTVQSLPTITNFTVPSGLINTSAPFILTKPTSNSTGAFTYTSSNTNVATISGTTVTITGVGTSIITAAQAAAGAYAAASITATLNVGYNPPSVAAPLPSVAPANVIPLLSSYAPYMPNRTIDTWGTSWQSAVTTDTTIATTRTIKYSNLVFSGTEFTGANSINATGMNFFHVDVWTPNSSALSVKLVDFGANNVYDGGGDDKASQIVLDANPTPFQWNSYNIPLSAFATTGLDTRGHLSQLLFVGSTTTIFVENVYFSTVTTLPVNLAEFTATKMGSVAQLSWKTLSEINNKGFAVERSADGITWNQLQFVNASTSGSNGASYSATDNSPLNGVNYYRLKQVDNDGKIAYSNTASVNFASTDVVGFSFYPNPAKSQINVALQTVQSSNASLSIVNVDGKTVKTIALTSQQSNSNIQISVSDIAKGNYFLVLKDGSTVKSSKVLVD